MLLHPPLESPLFAWNHWPDIVEYAMELKKTRRP